MDNSSAPQIVLVMNEIDAINFQKKGYEQPGCKVIACNSEFKNDLALFLEQSNLLVDKNVLVKDPYSSILTYHPLESASEAIHAEYFKRYATILSLLGATRVKVTEVKTNDEEKSVGGSVDVDVQNQGGNASGKWTTSSHKEYLMNLECAYEYNVDLEKALELIKYFSLQNDKDIDMIVKAIQAGTGYKYFDFYISLSQSLKRIFEFAAQIKPYAGIDISAQLKGNKEITKTYTLHVLVEFNNSHVHKASQS